MGLSKRQQQKEDTKARIVEAAYTLYAAQGFMVPTDAIAKAAGVSHGTIFLHFPTRDALFCYVLEDFGVEIGRRLHELAKEGEGVEGVLRAHLSGLEEHERFYERLITERQLLPIEGRDTFIHIQSVIAFHLHEAVEKEKEKGLVKDLPVNLIFNTWVGLIHYYLQNHDLFAPDAPVIGRYKEELLDVFLKLLGRN